MAFLMVIFDKLVASLGRRVDIGGGQILYNTYIFFIQF